MTEYEMNRLIFKEQCLFLYISIGALGLTFLIGYIIKLLMLK